MIKTKIFPNSVMRLEIEPLLSNHYMLAFFKRFCEAVTSRIWKYKKPRNYKYSDIDFLKLIVRVNKKNHI